MSALESWEVKRHLLGHEVERLRRTGASKLGPLGDEINRRIERGEPTETTRRWFVEALGETSREFDELTPFEGAYLNLMLEAGLEWLRQEALSNG